MHGNRERAKKVDKTGFSGGAQILFFKSQKQASRQKLSLKTFFDI
jgi:hypothetical protein